MSRRMVRHTRRPASRVVKAESRSHRLLSQNRIRILSVLACFGFSFTVLSLRLLEVALVGGGDLPFKRLVSEPQLMLQKEDTAKEEDGLKTPVDDRYRRRGIVDRNGLVLASNVQTASLVANPQLILEPQRVAEMLAKILGEDVAALQKKLAHPSSSFVYLKRQLSPQDQQQVNALGVPGLFFEPQERRAYPFGDLAAHVVGYVDIDNQGLSGIERGLNKRLAHATPSDKPLELSLDMRVQSVVHQELAAAMKTYSAIGGAAVVMDIKTGEIVSMVSLPTFDPNRPAKASDDARFNRVTLGAYEMGSSFKTFTFAMAMDAGIVGMRDGYDASRPIQAAGYTINDTHPYYRWLSVPEIFAYSSNIGTVQVAMDVGEKRQQEFMRDLGMFEPVKLELPESSQPIVPREWSRLASMTISFGHGISVSPLHLVRGIAAVSGDGTMVQPTLLKRDAASQHKEANNSDKIVSVQTAKTIRQLMRSVVQYGTAKKANVKGYAVGGKTGTAEKIVGGRYDADAKISSFVGIFPADNPAYVVFAMLDEPKGTKETYGYATGGWVAAPLVANVISRMGPLLGIQPADSSGDEALEELWRDATGRYLEAQSRPQPSRSVHHAAFQTH